MSFDLVLTRAILGAQITLAQWFNFEPPVTPSPADGHELLRHELAKLEYQEKRNWFEEFLNWILSPLNKLLSRQGRIETEPILIVLILIILGVIAWLVYSRFLRKPKPVQVETQDSLVDPRISPQQYRQQALNLRASDPQEAVKAGFRAIIARLDRSGLTSTAPGRTVGDVARTISKHYPELRQLSHECAQTFDIAAYALVPTVRVDSIDVDKVLYLDDQLMMRLQRIVVNA